MIAASFAVEWCDALRRTLRYGDDVAPRGMSVKERVAVTVRFHAERALLVSPTRALNYRFAVAEFLWIAAGLDRVAPLAKYNSVMRQFSDDGETLNGAYGPRLADQWDYVESAIRRDQATRQAVALVWRPREAPSKDVPCTVSAQFLARRGRLHSHWSMRSSDLWLGLPYDAFTFASLARCLAGRLGLVPGEVAITAGSSHLYREHWGHAALVLERGDAHSAWLREPVPDFPPPHAASLLETGRRPRHAAWWSAPWERYAAALESPTSAAAMAALLAPARAPA